MSVSCLVVAGLCSENSIFLMIIK